MIARELFQAGKVREAERALTAYLRDHPTDSVQRTFLFELLCFSGQYDRAEKHLSLLAEANQQTQMGAVLYYSAIHAERTRHELFQKTDYPQTPAQPSPPGKLNGKPFQTIRDADPVIGPRLEVFAAGAYLWLPFEHIAEVEIQPPKQLRDTLWVPAFVRTGPSFQGAELGEVLIPVVYPFSWKVDDEAVWLGRITDWAADNEGTEYPVGQKLLVVDGEEVPLLEVRTIELEAAQSSATST
jgi:type VI secretion system protein ImpE